MIAFPGSTAYARNHGVYLTDPQVVSPLRWQHHGQLSQPRVASRSCALGSLWSWTSCRGLDLEEFPLWQQLLCSLSLLSNSNGTWTLCQALFSLTCRTYPFLLSGVRRCSPGGMLSDMYLRFSFGKHPRRAPIPGPPFLPSLTLSSAPMQGFVLDIYYRGTEAEIRRCAKPDGRVPLVWQLPGRELWGPHGKGGWDCLPTWGRAPLLLEDSGSRIEPASDVV